MQTRRFRYSSQSGSVLVISLILAVILGTTLASYLYWVRTQNLLVAESQAWNAALTIAEAGVEEGMAQINISAGTAKALDYFGSIATNSWGAGPVYSRTNALGYSVTVSNDVPPTIYSSGTTAVPLMGKSVTRTVMVKTATNSLFGVAIAALSSVDNKGNDIMVDAYDSSDTVHFTNGVYNSTYAFAGGDVALVTGIIGIGNSDIHGRLFTTPSATYSLGPQGLVGDMPAIWPLQSGLQSPDWVFNDFNREFTDVQVPNTATRMVPTIGQSASNTLLSGSYIINGDVTLQNNGELYVAGVVDLYVTGSINAKNGSKITIGPGGALKLTVGGPSVVFNTVNNIAPNNAFNLAIYGLPTLTSFTLNGNDSYMGVLYAPEANFFLKGGGSGTLDYQGSVVVSSITMNGHFRVHYDKNLSRSGPPKGYTLAYWREI